MTWIQPIYDRRSVDVHESKKYLQSFNVNDSLPFESQKGCLNHTDFTRIENNLSIIVGRFFVNRAEDQGKLPPFSPSSYHAGQAVSLKETMPIIENIGKMLDIIPVPPENQPKPKNMLYYPHLNRIEEILDYYYSTDFVYKTELIRSKEGLGELELVFQRDETREPKKLFEIHVDNGVVKTSWRNYVKTAYEEWKDGVVLGEGKACSICFDGRWKLLHDKWLLITEEKPWCFWVDNQGVLYGQKWNDVSTRFQVSEDVMKVRSVRAWKSVNFKSLDLGLIVGYLKSDGKVYYRNYCEQDNGDVVWEAERTFETNGMVVAFNLFETIDYRVGLITVNSEGNVDMYFSKRNWAGMGIRGEFVDIQTSESVEILSLGAQRIYDREKINIDVKDFILHGYCKTDNLLLQVYNQNDGTGNWGKQVVFGTWHELYNLQGSDFKTTDSRGVSAYAYKIEYIGRGDWEHRYPYLYRAKYQNINNFKGECTAEILGITTQNAVGQTYEAMSLKFTPTGLVPVEVPAPQLISATNTDDQHIMLTFDRQIYNGATESVSAFVITSTAYKTTNTQEIVEDRHNVTACGLSDDKLQVILTIDVKTRIKRAINITVRYNNGAMTGEAEPVSNFETTFEATIVDYVNDPYTRENIDISAIETVDYVKIDFKSGYDREYININTTEKIKFIDISQVNP